MIVTPLVRWALAGAVLAFAAPARAGEVKLSFSNGRVSVVATDASPREILGEWARLGKVRVTNLDRLAGAPVTLQLTDVPEPRALETILRGTAGYIAAARREPGSAISQYDRILLMPGVAPPMPQAAPSPLANTVIGRGRPGQSPFGGSDNGTGTPGFTAAWGPLVTRSGPNRPATQAVTYGAMPQAAPLATSSQVPGVAVGQPSPAAAGAARPGEATSLPASALRPGVQLPAQTSGGPIKLPE